jgi:hypothetical protein
MPDPNVEVKEAPTFVVQDKTRKEIRINFDEAEFIIEAARLNFPSLWPDEPPTEQEKANPNFKRLKATEFVNKFIPRLVEKFEEEFGTKFTAGSIQTLYNKLIEYKQSLKKSTDDDTSQPSSTESTATTSPTTSTTTS